jgi:zinc transport system substrate-binding protein
MKTSRPIRLAIIAVILLSVVGLLALTQGKQKGATGDRLAVSATFYPVAEFARQVGGDRVTVTTLVTPGLEPHDYDPTPREMSAIYKSNVLVYNGAGFEPWVEKIKQDLTESGVWLAETSSGIPLRHAGAGHDDHDPHIWLDPLFAIRQVENIKDSLIKADPGHETIYKANAAAYIAKLKALDNSFSTGLATCQLREVIASHQSLGYLAARYKFEVVGLAGLSPDDEPSPGELAAAAEYAQTHGITHVFLETLANPKLTQTLASEVGAKAIAFNPLEGLSDQEQKDGKDYLTIQQENLQALRTALHCK